MAEDAPPALPDADCVRFLQATLPRLGLRWAGFRKVRRQVRKRLRQRLAELDLPDLRAYAAHLEAHPDELEVLDGLCRISISRFHRGIRAFEALRAQVLPRLAEAARAAGEPLRVWSAGCASGEEPYSIAIAWQLELAPRFPGVALRVLATDADPHMLERARAATYSDGSLRDLPDAWQVCFRRDDAGRPVLAERFRAGVELRLADVRDPPPAERFRLILCRYLVCTYFAPDLQRAVLARMLTTLEPGGVLVIGPKETLPDGLGLEAVDARLGIYRT